MTASAERTQLLDHLWACQEKKGFISDVDIKRLAKKFGISAIEVEGVATFYHFFKREPAGKYTIYLNNSILSKFAGYSEVRAAFEEETGTSFGSVDPSGTFGLFDTSCIGLSDQEPAALINFFPFTNLSPRKVRKVVDKLKSGKSPKDICDKVEDKIQYSPDADRSVFFRPFEEGKSLQGLKYLWPQEVIEEIKKSQLSGRGGAFFPTGVKWMLCRNYPGESKYVICNADEGEPGTFKDRALLNQLPGLVIEGMIACGYAIGAQEGVIYLRAEYYWLKEQLDKTIEKYRKMGWLGKNIPAKEPFAFDIRIQLGAGAYVCGEETALIESMEGKRGQPRPKVYFPVEKGYLNQPTVVNNVETFAAAARILELGAPFFNALGTQVTSGTKLLSVAGDCARPGIYEIEWGMSVTYLLELCGAENTQLMQFSGPSGQMISFKERNRNICGEDLTCGGSVMIFNKSRDILRILNNYMNFFKHESCGVCTPCRAGNFIMTRKLEKLANGLGSPEDLVKIRDWSKIMKTTSRCGLGQHAAGSLINALDRFPEFFNKLVMDGEAFYSRGFEPYREKKDYRSKAKVK